MQYKIIINAIKRILGDESQGRYKVVGYTKQTKSADEFIDNNKSVQVYFSEGNFPKNAGRMIGPKLHDITVNIDLMASAAAKGDLSVLNSATSTATQKAVALASIQDAAIVADDLIDELIDIVWNILGDARNLDLGLSTGSIANRWIDSIKKDTNLENGDLIVKTANLKYTCRVEEECLGDKGTSPDTVVIDSEITPGDTEGAGVTVENDNT